MAPALDAIPMLYFVATITGGDGDRYLQNTLPATARWDRRVHCFTSSEEAEFAAVNLAARYDNVRTFEASGPALQKWFALFTIGDASPAIETIPIDFHFVEGSKWFWPDDRAKRPIAPSAELPPPKPARKILMAGAHGSGKSSIAARLTELCQMPTIQSYAGQIQALWGVTANATFPLQRRILIQRHILMKWWADYKAACHAGGAIFDRTAYDIAAYTLADVDRDVHDADDSRAVAQFVITAMTYMSMIHNDPNATVIHVPLHNLPQATRGTDKAPNGAYAQLHDTVIRGLMAQETSELSPTFFLPAQITDVEMRTQTILANLPPLDLNA